MKIHTILSALTLALTLAQNPVVALEKVWSTSGFDQPESVLQDSQTHDLFVTNINGNPLELNREGYISRLSADGKILQHKWSTGLDAPKGMALFNETLYVADMTFLRLIDRSTGQLMRSIPVAGSKMLNDVTAAKDGTIYISDLLAGIIYKYDGNEVKAWFTHEDIPHPNGVYYHQGKLLIASWGKGINDDFTTKTPGTLYRLDIKTQTLATVKQGKHLGNLDGIGMSGGTIITNDWINGKVFAVNADCHSLLLNAGQGAADISVAENILYIPMMHDKRVDAYAYTGHSCTLPQKKK